MKSWFWLFQGIGWPKENIKSEESHHTDEADDQQSQRSFLILKSESAAIQRADKWLAEDCRRADQKSSRQVKYLSLSTNYINRTEAKEQI